MKKILALAMTSVLAVMTLASCGSKYSGGEKFAAGKFEEGKYENASIGIGVNVPEGYAEVDIAELPMVDGVTYDFGAVTEDGSSIYVAVENNKEKYKIDKAAEESLKALVGQYESMGFKIDDQKLEDYKVGDNTYLGYTLTVTKGLPEEKDDKKKKSKNDEAEEAKVEENAEEVPVEIVTIKQAGFFVKCDTKIATVAVTSELEDVKKIIADNFYTIG